MNKNVDIWAIRRLDACTLRFRCRLPDEKEVEELCFESGSTSLSKVTAGLPVRAKGRMKRWGFLVGAVLFIGIIVLMSNVIWRIDISGYKDKTQLIAVEKFLKENGLSISAQAFNQKMIEKGYMVELTRPSSKGVVKKFKSITGEGLNFGENQVNPNNPKSTQPLYYEDKFFKLLTLLDLKQIA